MTHAPKMAPDWGRLLDDLLKAGLSQANIGTAMGVDLTDRMLRHYRAGVQPAFHRGDAVVVLWCATQGKKREDVPMLEVVKGHRVDSNREAANGPTMRSPLPQWPPIHASAKKTAAAKQSAPRRKREAA